MDSLPEQYQKSDANDQDRAGDPEMKVACDLLHHAQTPDKAATVVHAAAEIAASRPAAVTELPILIRNAADGQV